MKSFFSIVLLVLLLAGNSTSQSPTPSDKLNKTQQSQVERGYGMFIHFGINTFNEIEWSNGILPASSYNPTNLDCDQWVKVAKDAGFTSGSRRSGALSFPSPAGAAHGSGNFETLSTLSPPFRNHR